MISESNVFDFSGSANRVKGVVDLSVKVGSKKSNVAFQFINISNPNFNALLGHKWIHHN